MVVSEADAAGEADVSSGVAEVEGSAVIVVDVEGFTASSSEFLPDLPHTMATKMMIPTATANITRLEGPEVLGAGLVVIGAITGAGAGVETTSTRDGRATTGASGISNFSTCFFEALFFTALFFVAVFFAAVFFTGFFAVAFLATAFLATAFLAAGFTTDFFATFLAGAFLAVAFFTGLAAAFLATDFFATAFFAGFFALAFLTATLTPWVAQRSSR